MEVIEAENLCLLITDLDCLLPWITDHLISPNLKT